MRKVILKMAVSVDGFVNGPKGELDWVFETMDAELTKWIVDTVWQAGVHIMGASTYKDMAAFWPNPSVQPPEHRPFAPPMNEIPKVVFSRTLKEASWKDSRIARGDLREEISRLKRRTLRAIAREGEPDRRILSGDSPGRAGRRSTSVQGFACTSESEAAKRDHICIGRGRAHLRTLKVLMMKRKNKKALPKIVSPNAWQKAHEKLLAKEKAATRARDVLAADRRRQPMVEIEKEYVFVGPQGKASLLDLFERRRQLIVYHFMFTPGVDGWPKAG